MRIPTVTLKGYPEYRAIEARDDADGRLWNIYRNGVLCAMVYGNVQDARRTIRNVAAVAA